MAFFDSANIRSAYLYLVSGVGLIIFLVGVISLGELALKTWVFPVDETIYMSSPYDVKDPAAPATTPEQEAKIKEYNEKMRKNDLNRQLASGVTSFVVGFLLFGHHWNLIQKDFGDKKEKDKKKA